MDAAGRAAAPHCAYPHITLRRKNRHHRFRYVGERPDANFKRTKRARWGSRGRPAGPRACSGRLTPHPGGDGRPLRVAEIPLSLAETGAVLGKLAISRFDRSRSKRDSESFIFDRLRSFCCSIRHNHDRCRLDYVEWNIQSNRFRSRSKALDSGRIRKRSPRKVARTPTHLIRSEPKGGRFAKVLERSCVKSSACERSSSGPIGCSGAPDAIQEDPPSSRCFTESGRPSERGRGRSSQRPAARGDGACCPHPVAQVID